MFTAISRPILITSIGLTSIRHYSFTPKNQGVLDKVSSFLNRMGGKTTIGKATAIFFNCQMQSNNPWWHKKGLIPADFRSKQLLLTLHIWMVHKRLLKEGRQGLLVQEALFDEFWEDTANRIRGQGINELSVNKYLKEVQTYSFRCCVELDKVLTLESLPFEPKVKFNENTPEEVVIEYKNVEQRILEEIGGILWRLIYLKNENIPEDHILDFARYVRNEQISLLTLPPEAIFEGRIKWGPYPKWDNVQISPEEVQQSLWREATSPSGRSYYWNIKTRETTWDKPADFV